jgi:hypothetical protein
MTIFNGGGASTAVADAYVVIGVASASSCWASSRICSICFASAASVSLIRISTRPSSGIFVSSCHEEGSLEKLASHLGLGAEPILLDVEYAR